MELLTSSSKLDNISSKMSKFDLSLTNLDSISTVVVSGKLDMTLDLRNSFQLEKLMKILKHFKISSNLKRKGQSLNKKTLRQL